MRLYDEELLSISLEDAVLAGMKAHILSVKDDRKEVFPLDLDLTDEGVMKWLEKRVIPKNCAFDGLGMAYTPRLMCCLTFTGRVI